MSKKLQLKIGVEIIIEDAPFANGGEGDLFRILSPSNFKDQVAKIYKQDKRSKEREHKIKFLSQNQPQIQVHGGNYSVIWVNQVAYENGSFVGFIMPIAKGEKLELLCYEELPKTLGNEWKK